MVSILGANSVSGGYEVSNSLRFNEPDASHLSRTPSSSGNRKTWTFSCWIKRSALQAQLNDYQAFFTAGTTTNRDEFFFDKDAPDKLCWYGNYGGTAYGVKSDAVFRDVSAWYHIVWVGDTTQGTEANRLKLYVNSTQQTLTEFGGGYLSQNTDMYFNHTTEHEIGTYSEETQHFAGYMAEAHLIDGTAKAPTDFGEFDEDSGIWKPKRYSGSYGTNGFKLEFKQTGTSQNASGIGADTSGEGNHFAVSNLAATDVTTDSPTNNFCTLNPLNSSASVALSEGNTKHTNSGANDQASAATMGFANGKWYWEVKCVDKGEVGINLDSDILQLSNDSTVGSNDANIKATALITNSAGGSNDLRHNGGTESITSVSVADNDIISIAVDVDNGKIWFAKNGTYFNSGDPAAGSNEAKDFSGAYTSGNFITPTGVVGTGDGDILEFNFGNPSFSISSGNSDANGYGNFEYAVPSGYYALCTKNLAEFG